MIEIPRQTAFAILTLGLALCIRPALVGAQGTPTAPEKIIIDTDIGDDVDDAFALALAVKGPELEILGVTTTFGDTEARANITHRFLREAGRAENPILAGKPAATKNPLTHRPHGYASAFAKPQH